MTRRIAHAAQIVAVVLALALVPAALAAKGGGGGHNGGGGTTGGSGSLSLVMATDLNGNGLPNWGDTIKFNVSTTATSSPYVVLSCYQGGALVYTAEAGYFTSYPWPNDFILTAPTWTPGAASCTASIKYLSNGKWVTVSSINFDVGA